MHDGVRRFASLLPLGLEREVDHHDRVFLHEADEQHDADERVHAQVDVKDQQRERRTERRERQSGQNGDRMYETLIQDAEHHVDHENRDHEERQQSCLRRLERLCCSREVRRDRARQRIACDMLDLVHGVAQGNARPEIERERHRRQLACMVHRDGADALRDGGDRAQGNERAVVCQHVQQRQRRQILLILRQQLHHDPVLVVRRVDRRDLARSIRVV